MRLARRLFARTFATALVLSSVACLGDETTGTDSSLAPSLSAVSPNPPQATRGAQSLDFQGAGFQSGLTVDLGSPSGGSVTLSGAQITNVTPTSFTMQVDFNGVPGIYSLRVTNPGGPSSELVRMYVETSVAATTFAPALGVDLAASTRTSTGLYYRDITVGTGAVATAGQEVTVRYAGWLANGTQFDPAVAGERGVFPFVLGRNQAIPGFDQGVTGMRIGGRRQLVIRPGLGYGANANGPIPGNSVLIFDVELVSAR